MYTIVLTILLLIAGFIAYKGIATAKKSKVITGISLALIIILFFWFMGFWGELLWFRQTGYPGRFWTEWITRAGLFLSSFVISGFIVFLLTYSLKQEKKLIRYLSVLTGALLGGFIWFINWDIFLQYINRVQTNITEPILRRTTGFYLFEYPLLVKTYQALLYIALIGFGANIISILQPSENYQEGYRIKEKITPWHSIFVSTAIIIFILAFGRYLKRFGLLFSQQGVVFGPGWTDDHIRLPLISIIVIITAIFGILILIPSVRLWIQEKFTRRRNGKSGVEAVFILPGSLFVIWFILLTVIPALFQWLKVEPNEITLERPYIENNIEYTKKGFHLDKVEVMEFPASEELSRDVIETNRSLLSNIRLWDYRALDAVFKQFQEIRLYYEFLDVDIDRYYLNDKYRQVMISAREMYPGNLPAESQTFINKRFKYTHGYGIVATMVNEFTTEGLPNLLIKDIPPVSTVPEFNVEEPAIYYGELTGSYVVVNSEEEEFDYPSGENNIYTHYSGDGGVLVSNFWRKLLYGWKMGGTRFLLSGYPTKESRIMFHRHIIDRIKTLAPFLYFDDDPYIVNNKGQLYWIVDAYTASKYYPYSEPFSAMEKIGYDSSTEGEESLRNYITRYLEGKNYLRNAVKITINAFTGKANFYIFEEEDPLIQVYDKIFPGLFRKASEIPDDLREHIRYPADMLLVQGLVYAKYHMTDPTVFYNQEDLWVRATEKYYGNVQPVEPYYIMWEQPGSDELEFVLMLPFTPKDKQVMIGWIAGMCDDEDYGRFLAYKFPKEKRILGTQQVETKIDQDSYLSGQLTLWDQRGSNVIRGNVLAIPIDETVIYVEPIYLQSQTAAYPELRLVALMHNDRLSYAETFEEALDNLIEPSRKQAREEASQPAMTGTASELISRASNAFNDYLEQMQQRNFQAAASALNTLQNALEELSRQQSGN